MLLLLTLFSLSALAALLVLIAIACYCDRETLAKPQLYIGRCEPEPAEKLSPPVATTRGATTLITATDEHVLAVILSSAVEFDLLESEGTLCLRERNPGDFARLNRSGYIYYVSARGFLPDPLFRSHYFVRHTPVRILRREYICNIRESLLRAGVQLIP